LRGLDLLGLQGSLPKSNEQLSTEVRIAMTNIVDPWNRKQRIDNVRLEIDKTNLSNVNLIDSITWPEQTTGRTRVNVSTWTIEEKESF
jgi:DNA polymerase II small subunit/DNA polymerase delta subunit B